MGENKKRNNESIRKNKRKKKKSSILLRVLFTILLIGVLLSGGVYAYLSNFDNNAIDLNLVLIKEIRMVLYLVMVLLTFL